jgi:hypothetical protein
LTFITFTLTWYLLVTTIIYSHEFIQLITRHDHQRKPRYIPKSRRNFIIHRLSDYSKISHPESRKVGRSWKSWLIVSRPGRNTNMKELLYYERRQNTSHHVIYVSFIRSRRKTK